MHAHAFPKVQGWNATGCPARSTPNKPSSRSATAHLTVSLGVPDVPDNWRGQIACGLCCQWIAPWALGARLESSRCPWPPWLRWFWARPVGTKMGAGNLSWLPLAILERHVWREEIGSKPNDKVCHDCSACISTTYVQFRVAISKNVLI